MRRRAVYSVVVLSMIFFVLADGLALGADLIVYSGRKEKAVRPVVDEFSRATGINVALKTGKTSGLANTILFERDRPRADVFISTVGSVMEVLAREGLLAPYQSPRAAHIPAEFRSEAGDWTGISGRARIIMFNTKHVPREEAPQSVFDLTDPKWKNKIAIAGTQERTTLSWVSWLVVEKGRPTVETYLTTLVTQGLAILSDNSEVWRGVGRGEFAVGLTNSPNYHLAVDAGFPVGVVYPDQDSIGTLVNPNAVAIIRGGPHPEAAKRFVDFLLSPEGQRLLVEEDYEMPFIQGVSSGVVKPLASVNRPSVSVGRLADMAESTLEMLRTIDPRW